MIRFLVTYGVITEESVQDGDTSSAGFCDSAGCILSALDPGADELAWSLREIREQFGDTLESASEYNAYFLSGSDQWLDSFVRTVGESDCSGSEVLSVNFAMHRPKSVTKASWLRVCKLLGAKYF